MNHKYPTPQLTGKILTMSDHEFTEWGMEQWAYIKPIQENDQPVFAIFLANGQRIGVESDRNIAMALVFQEDFTPLSLH